MVPDKCNGNICPKKQRSTTILLSDKVNFVQVQQYQYD